MKVLGIDPGLTGGIALLEAGDRRRVIFAADIPTIGDDAKRRIDVLAVLRLLQPHEIAHAFVERAQAMPDQGASSGFIYGRAVGALEACVVGMQVPITIVESTAWKKTHGLIKPSGTDGKAWSKVVKKNSLQRARFLFPEAFDMLAREKDHGRAEAILIAAHGLSILQPPIKSSSPHSRNRADQQLDLVDAIDDSV